MIETVTMYKCSETGKLFKTERGAKNSAKRAQEKKLAESFDLELFSTQQNYVRLNATSPLNIIELVKSKAEEFWGLKIETFSHNYPRVTSGNGYTCDVISFGRCGVRVSSSGSKRLEHLQSKSSFNNSISSLLFGSSGFIGLNTDSGCPGRCDNYPMSMGLCAQIDQFPIIYKRYQEWAKHKSEYYSDIVKESSSLELGRILAMSTPEFIELSRLNEYYTNCRQIISDRMKEVVEHHSVEFLAKWRSINPEVKKDMELFGMFG